MKVETGWYPDASRAGSERYWDGDAWTAESRWPGTHPFASPVPPGLPAPDDSLRGVVPTLRPTMSGMPHESSVGFWLPPTDWLVPTPSGETAERTRRRRRRRRTLLRASSLTLAVVLAAGGSFLILGRHTNADAAVVAAVNSSLSSRTADLVISGSGGTASAQFTISGTGAIDFGHNALRLTANFSTGADQLEEQEVYLNGVAYVNPGKELGQILPGKSWVSLNLGQLTSGITSSALGVGTGSLGNDPAAVLRALGQDGNTATDIGSSAINGVPVEGYAVRVDA